MDARRAVTGQDLIDCGIRILAGATGAAWQVTALAAGDRDTVDLPEWGVALTAADLGEGSRPVAGIVGSAVKELLAECARVYAHAEEAERLARTDHLTGLLNRWGWDAAMSSEDARCARHGLHGIVAVVDLDDLKRVNDTDGHLGGDTLLRMAAGALRAACRSEDVVARIGGDEFGVITVHDRLGEDLVIVRRLRDALDAAGVAASIGACGRSGVGGLRAAFRDADRAMYSDKVARRNARSEREDASRSKP